MADRSLYLVGYDISEDRIRQHALKEVKPHTLSGQKSFYECWLSASEFSQLKQELCELMDVQTDRVILVKIAANDQPIMLGQARLSKPDDDHLVI